MNSYLVEPRDPLIVRDGRPMAAGMPQMRSLDFPLPSTVAGLVRTRAGRGDDGRFDTSRIPELRAMAVRGPWLVELGEDGGRVESFFPAPRDGVWFKPEGEMDAKPEWHPLQPREPRTGVLCDLPEHLKLVGFEEGDEPKGKPEAGDAFWSWSALAGWLVDRKPPEVGAGLRTLMHERRMHVALDSNARTVVEGGLFATDGLRFWSGEGPNARRLALGFETAAELEKGLATLGGERRLSYLRRVDAGLPGLPSELGTRLEAAREARLTMLTPACFEAGAVPEVLHGRRVTAACVGRPEVMSGWDMEKRGPKPTRRLVPAGSVYWVELPEAYGEKVEWLNKAWAQPAPEQSQQDCLDGFGLTLVGVK